MTTIQTSTSFIYSQQKRDPKAGKLQVLYAVKFSSTGRRTGEEKEDQFPCLLLTLTGGRGIFMQESVRLLAVLVGNIEVHTQQASNVLYIRGGRPSLWYHLSVFGNYK